jgi:hypothetical protein
LFFGEHLTDEQLSRFLRLHRPRHEERLRLYRALLESEPEDSFRAVTLRLGVAYEEAVLGWFDALPWR